MNSTDAESSFKSYNYAKSSENRRKSFLAKQKQARDKNRTNHRIDTLSKEEEEPLPNEMAIDTSDSTIPSMQSTPPSDHKKHRLYVKPVLSIPEWMIEPINFSNTTDSSSWYVKIRPEGTHILLHTSRPSGHSSSSSGKRGKNTVLITIKSPNNTIINTFIYEGSNTKYIPPDTILDCIYDINTNTYYILDVLQWNGYDVTDTTGEFRLSFWLHNKLIEHGFTDTMHILEHDKVTVNEYMDITTTTSTYTYTDTESNSNIHTSIRKPSSKTSNKSSPRFVEVPYYECTYDNLITLYESSLPSAYPSSSPTASASATVASTSSSPCHIDGWLFYHKAGHYHCGLNPLVVYWKDSRTCRYLSQELMGATDTHMVAAVTCYLQVCQVASSSTSTYSHGEPVTDINMMYEGLPPPSPLLSSCPSSSSSSISPNTLLPKTLALCTLDGFIISYLSTEQLTQQHLIEGQVIKYNIDIAPIRNIYPDPSAMIQRYNELSCSGDLPSYSSDGPTGSLTSPPQSTLLSTPPPQQVLLLPGLLVIEQSNSKGKNYDRCKSDRKLPDPMSKVLFHLLHSFNHITTAGGCDEGLDEGRVGHVVTFADILSSV